MEDEDISTESWRRKVKYYASRYKHPLELMLLVPQKYHATVRKILRKDLSQRGGDHALDALLTSAPASIIETWCESPMILKEEWMSKLARRDLPERITVKLCGLIQKRFDDRQLNKKAVDILIGSFFRKITDLKNHKMIRILSKMPLMIPTILFNKNLDRKLKLKLYGITKLMLSRRTISADDFGATVLAPMAIDLSEEELLNRVKYNKKIADGLIRSRHLLPEQVVRFIWTKYEKFIGHKILYCPSTPPDIIAACWNTPYQASNKQLDLASFARHNNSPESVIRSIWEARGTDSYLLRDCIFNRNTTHELAKDILLNDQKEDLRPYTFELKKRFGATFVKQIMAAKSAAQTFI